MLRSGARRYFTTRTIPRKEKMQDISAVNIVTNPKLYKMLCKFYAAGYECRRYPRPLNKVRHSMRDPLRQAYSEGVSQRRTEARLARVLYGA